MLLITNSAHQNPDQPMLGVSRDYIALVDRATMVGQDRGQVYGQDSSHHLLSLDHRGKI